MMKRYIVFAGYHHEAQGGCEDFFLSTDSIDEALGEVKRITATGAHWAHVLDSEEWTFTTDGESWDKLKDADCTYE